MRLEKRILPVPTASTAAVFLILTRAVHFPRERGGLKDENGRLVCRQFLDGLTKRALRGEELRIKLNLKWGRLHGAGVFEFIHGDTVREAIVTPAGDFLLADEKGEFFRPLEWCRRARGGDAGPDCKVWEMTAAMLLDNRQSARVATQIAWHVAQSLERHLIAEATNADVGDVLTRWKEMDSENVSSHIRSWYLLRYTYAGIEASRGHNIVSVGSDLSTVGCTGRMAVPIVLPTGEGIVGVPQATHRVMKT